jgi:energy-coupling factor transporter ATP-binding protein EcfA2
MTRVAPLDIDELEIESTKFLYRNALSPNILISDSDSENTTSFWALSCIDKMVSCFCPCFIMGNLTTKVEREEVFCGNDDYSCGRKGCITCAYTCILCVTCWPLSPGLGGYLCQQRQNLHKIYGYDYKTKHHSSYIMNDLKGFFWPCAVKQHQLFLNRRYQDNVLHYSWAYNPTVINFHVDMPKITDHVVLIVGPSDSGKSQLLLKLSGGLADGLGENKQIMIGLKPLHVSSSHISYVQFWDVPENYIHTITHFQLHQISTILLIFDSTNETSFVLMKNIYKELYCNPLLADKKYICIATKCDMLVYDKEYEDINTTFAQHESDSDESEDEEMGNLIRAKDQSKIDRGRDDMKLLKLAQAWSAKRGFPFFTVSSPYNFGISDVYRTITAQMK